jgi:hypothetical protein
MSTSLNLTALESELKHFDPRVRAETLAKLAELAHRGAIPDIPESRAANMHCHTFFSFNAYGHSPSSLAWLAKRRGIKLMGIVDFDVLDGVDEFLDACDLLGLRGSAGIETRVFIPEFATREINSPGEPGISYHMGIGFASGRVPESVAHLLAGFRRRAVGRNQSVVERVNAYLSPVTIDYERDVIPLTPAGTATERHIVQAYVHAAERTTTDLAGFWASKLQMPSEEIAALLQDSAGFQNLVRSRLIKRGGVGYVEPDSANFPRLDEFHTFIQACGALPCAAWLDGTSPGEQDIEELLALFIEQGVVALNMIPDRNWNVPDPELRSLKVKNLHQVVQLARRMALPINAGTEMNSFGQKVVDDFDVPEMAPLRQDFLDGAHFIYGHTALQRALGLGYQSAWAADHLPTRPARNHFYTEVGYRLSPGLSSMERLRNLDPSLAPDQILSNLSQVSIHP